MELDPKNVAFLDTLAEVLFRLGRRDDAVEQIRKCFEPAGRCLTYCDGLGFTGPACPACDDGHVRCDECMGTGLRGS